MYRNLRGCINGIKSILLMPYFGKHPVKPSNLCTPIDNHLMGGSIMIVYNLEEI